MRMTLRNDQIHSTALKSIAEFHPDAIKDISTAMAQNEWVVVGMSQNPFVKKARRYLEAKGVSYHYMEYGSYFSQWKQRLAIKLWSGWPTFPQVFHKGKLVGGFNDLEKYDPR